jgi:hypothetical protein
MPQPFATEKRALGICDRCGLSFKLAELRYETINLNKNNLRVCRVCWDPDHPQLQLGRYIVDDPIALREARIDTGERASTTMANFNPIGSLLIEAGLGQAIGVT